MLLEKDLKMLKALQPSVILKSEPFKENTVVTGTMEVEFDFKTSAKDTDFYAVLIEYSKDGKYFPITLPGKFKASYLQGFDKQRAVTPGKVYRAKLTLWDSAYRVNKGNRIGVLINSNLFPLAAPNFGLAEPIFSATKSIPQTNTLISTAKSPAVFRFYALPDSSNN